MVAENGNRRRGDGGPRPAELVRSATRTLAELTGRQPETVLGLRRDGEEWEVMLEVAELYRIPRATDVIGCYAVTLDDDGDLVSYERRGRYLRSQTGDQA